MVHCVKVVAKDHGSFGVPRAMSIVCGVYLIFLASPLLAVSLVWDSALMDEYRFRCPPEMRAFIIESAETVLDEGVAYSVTYNDATSPLANDPRDYFSTHANWWPNPDTPDGLPYIRQDEINPDSRLDMDQMTGLYLSVLKCSLAYHLSREERFAEFAAGLVWTFFLDETTGMKPNMDFSKIIPGVNEEGSFEVATLSNRVRKLWDAIEILRTSGHWTPYHEVEMQDWSQNFLTWMEVCPKALREYEAPNNHSTAYHLIAVILAKCTGDYQKALLYGDHFSHSVIPSQFDIDGSQPEEMSRTDNLFYHVYNLKSAIDILSVVNDLGLDFKRKLERPLEFLLPFLDGRREWNLWPDTPRPHNFKWEHDLLVEAAIVLDHPQIYSLGSGLYSGALLDEYIWPRPLAEPSGLEIMNAPNPFNSATVIQCELDDPGTILVEVFDIAGKRVRTLFQGTSDSHRIQIPWDGRGNHGNALPSGTYFFRVQTRHLTGTNKTILLK